MKTVAVAAFYLGILALLALLYLLDRRNDKAWEAEKPVRRPSDLSSGVGWARESTPIYDRLVCERIEREEGWVA